MENTVIVNASEKKAQPSKAFWLAGFVVSYLFCYNLLDLIWSECITSKGYSFDIVKLPGHIVSALLIGMLIHHFSKGRKTKEEDQA